MSEDESSRSAFALVSAVQELSLARDLPAVASIVRTAGRNLIGADGATFVLREEDRCHYVDEDAIEPLWKGRRFPISSCVSGWVMTHAQAAIIPDIYADARVAIDPYRPTFVKSMVMVPIRTTAPIGAIGNYWANARNPSDGEVRLLQALADSASIAIENVQLYGDLERRVEERTTQLRVLNEELDSFSYSVSHDLRAPLRSIDGFGDALQDELGEVLGDEGREHLRRIRGATHRMRELIDDLLELSRVGRAVMYEGTIDLSAIAREVITDIERREPGRNVRCIVADSLLTRGDARLVKIIFENLLSNAWKFTSKQAAPLIEVGASLRNGQTVFFVRDNGAGFDARYSDKLFTAFQRLHSASDYPGSGVGLATVQRVVRRHGGHIWAQSEEGKGAAFFFTLRPSPS